MNLHSQNCENFASAFKVNKYWIWTRFRGTIDIVFTILHSGLIQYKMIAARYGFSKQINFVISRGRKDWKIRVLTSYWFLCACLSNKVFIQIQRLLKTFKSLWLSLSIEYTWTNHELNPSWENKELESNVSPRDRLAGSTCKHWDTKLKDWFDLHN